MNSLQEEVRKLEKQATSQCSEKPRSSHSRARRVRHRVQNDHEQEIAQFDGETVKK